MVIDIDIVHPLFTSFFTPCLSWVSGLSNTSIVVFDPISIIFTLHVQLLFLI